MFLTRRTSQATSLVIGMRETTLRRETFEDRNRSETALFEKLNFRSALPDAVRIGSGSAAEGNLGSQLSWDTPRTKRLCFLYEKCSQRALYRLAVDVCPSRRGKDGDVWVD